MVNRDEVPPARCDLGHGALAERHFSITRTARKPNGYRDSTGQLTEIRRNDAVLVAVPSFRGFSFGQAPTQDEPPIRGEKRTSGSRGFTRSR